MKHISFLLGAGFSKPAGLPLATDINSFFIDLREQDITFYNYEVTSGKSHEGEYEKMRFDFACSVIEYYIEEVINEFNYEYFYDWYSNLLSEKKKIDRLINKFTENYEHLFLEFDYYFNNLIKFKLEKIFSTFQQYSEFVNYITANACNSIFINTLNHDLLVESIFERHKIVYDNGFNKTSKYSDDHGNKNEFLKFDDDFKRNIHLIKLHGSIEHYQIGEEPYDIIKTSERVYSENSRTDFKPKFITGINKSQVYKSDSYYSTVISRFKNNLALSDLIFIIGYSFNDEGINEILLSKIRNNLKKKKVLIISKNIDAQNVIVNKIKEITNTEIFEYGIENYKFANSL